MRGETRAAHVKRMRAKAERQRYFEELDAKAAASQGRKPAVRGGMPILTWERPKHFKFIGDCKVCNGPMVSARKGIRQADLASGVRVHNARGVCRNCVHTPQGQAIAQAAKAT